MELLSSSPSRPSPKGAGEMTWCAALRQWFIIETPVPGVSATAMWRCNERTTHRLLYTHGVSGA